MKLFNRQMLNRITLKMKNFYRFNFLGLSFGLVGYFFALTPSLMPRPTLFLGILAGLGFSIGYGLGTLTSYLIRWVGVREPSELIKYYAWRFVLSVGLIIFIIFGFEATDWQNEVRLLVGEDPHEGGFITLAVIISFITFNLMLLISRAIRILNRAVRKQVYKVGVIPRRLASLVSIFLVLIIMFTIINGVLFDSFKSLANSIYSSSNQQTDEGVVKPISEFRSGSESSLVSWDSLGRNGRNFVSSGPSTNELEEFSGKDAEEPVRVYVGLESRQTISERAKLAVRELERTQAFDKEVLVVMTATGSGWIEPQSADSLEYMYNGDSALVTIQYSYLPSWMSLLINRDDATEAGRELYNAVYDKWVSLPEDDRPKLIAYGLSLGSYGGQAAFSGEQDLVARTDGALFMGTPSFSSPWNIFTEDRDSTSPEIKPIYNQGRNIRFAAKNQDISSLSPGPWNDPKILYLQHPSDPVVWWNPDTILNRPDYLSEPRGYDVSPRTTWFPVISFLQATVDQFFGVSVPAGHGHNYPPTIVESWRAVTSPNDWNDKKSRDLQSLINSYPIE